VDYLTRRVLDRVVSQRGNEDLFSLRILDPSCGGGAFLVAATRYMFDAIEQRLVRRLSPQQRLDFVQSTILGTDIDARAVLWTRRALLLTVWETATLHEDMPAADSLSVPTLDKNIRCADFLTADLEPADAMIGGPPFVRLHELRKANTNKLREYRSRFLTARSGQFDLYMLFFEQALRRLKPSGWLGWSVSNTFLRSASGRTVRQVIAADCAVNELVEFEARKLYPDAVTQIALVLLQKTSSPASCRHVWVRHHSSPRPVLESLLTTGAPGGGDCSVTNLSPTACRGADWILDSAERRGVVAQIGSVGRSFAQLPLQIHQGVVTGCDSMFLVSAVRKYDDGVTLVEDRLGAQQLLESALLRPIIRDRDVQGFDCPKPRSVCITPYGTDGSAISEDRLRDFYPRIYRYLMKERARLDSRTGTPAQPWYAFRSSSSLLAAQTPRILLKRVTSGGDFTFVGNVSFLCHSSVLFISPTFAGLDPLVLLGILNSSVFWTFVSSSMPTMGEGRFALRVNQLLNFAIPDLAFQPSTSQCELRDAVFALLGGAVARGDRRSAIHTIDRVVAEMYGVPATALLTPSRRALRQ
jgi:hypothetical protein